MPRYFIMIFQSLDFSPIESVRVDAPRLRFPLTSVAIFQNLFLPLDGRGRKRKCKDFGIWQHW
jgi:hypothetical protein